MHGAQGSQAFGRSNRLRRRSDYVAVQEQGRRVSGRHYLLLALRRPAKRGERPGEQIDAEDASRRRPTPVEEPRFGVTVSRKIGGAVERNRVKRWVRESYRRLRPLAPRGMDLVLIARPSAKDSGLSGTAAELESLLRRLGRDSRS